MPKAPAKVKAAKRRARMFDALRKLPAQKVFLLRFFFVSLELRFV